MTGGIVTGGLGIGGSSGVYLIPTWGLGLATASSSARVTDRCSFPATVTDRSGFPAVVTDKENFLEGG